MTNEKSEFPTVLGHDAVFKGQLQFEKGVRLLGKFEGEITSDGELLVEEGATLNGDVHAGMVRIDGHIKGNVHAKTKIQLSATARLEGDVQAARLEVAEGAVLIGKCMVGVNGQSTTPKTASVGTVNPAKLKQPERNTPVTRK